VEVGKAFNFSKTFTIQRIYLPAMVPTIVFNSGVSMANGWYFLMASEIITLGSQEVKLPGLGSSMMNYLAQGNILGRSHVHWNHRSDKRFASSTHF